MADLCLGTAQLGMKYGINNKVGKLNEEAVFDILDNAIAKDIEVIDTASIYGEAEKIIGRYFSKNSRGRNIKIISKQCDVVDKMNTDTIGITIRRELECSLSHLQRQYLDGYLLHSYREVDNMETLKVLRSLKNEGLIRNIGVSVYEVDEAEKAIEEGEIDYLQMPCSIFDQRGLKTGIFKKAKENGVTVFTRSAFLQGLLMMKKEEVPDYLKGLIPYLDKFEELLINYGLERRHAIIKFILANPLIDYMVFGVETREQLDEILREKETEKLPEEFVTEVKQEFNNISPNLILPIHWGKR